MKAKKIVKVIGRILLLVITISLIIIAYYILVDIESKETRQIKQTCNLKIKKFMDRKIFVVTPKNVEKSNLKILYFHGGSYVAEATKEHWDFIEKIVKDIGATVIIPDYPLTPKYNYKDVFRMVVPLYKEIIEKVNSEELIIMGDSAGGGLSLALVERIKEDNEKLPNKTILISPWLDTRLENEKIDEVQKKDKSLNKETLKLAGISYSGEEGKDSYLVNPIDGDLSGIKNITIFTGTYDILNPDVHILKEKAEKVGTKINIKQYEKAGHIWLISNNSEKDLVEQGYKDLIQEINQ